tara:strand:- start:217 stop:834 length:618 start_codon:yes stop_codon:yes gene_type:complete
MAYLNFFTLKCILKLTLATNSVGLRHSKVKPFVRLHKVYLSDYSYISNNCSLAYVSIGSYVSVGPRVCSIHGIHPYQASSQSPLFHQPQSSLFSNHLHVQIFQDPNQNQLVGATGSTIVIEDDVWLGSDVKILSGLRIGRGSVIGSCTFVNRDVPPYSVAYGIPMRIAKQRFSKEQISDLENSRWWTLPPKLAAPILLKIHESHN